MRRVLGLLALLPGVTAGSVPLAAPEPKVDWDSFGFALNGATDVMYVATWREDTGWLPGRLVRRGRLELDPAATVLNYGQALFEGLKAYRFQAEGASEEHVALFRPELNAQRLNEGCDRLLLPQVEEDVFVQACAAVALANGRWVPPRGRGALYLRPVIYGSGARLGVGPSPEVTLVIYASPVNTYFSNPKPISLLVQDEYFRSTGGGAGGVKFSGNYAPTFIASTLARLSGCDEILYLDAKRSNCVEEAGAANFFCVMEPPPPSPEKSKWWSLNKDSKADAKSEARPEGKQGPTTEALSEATPDSGADTAAGMTSTESKEGGLLKKGWLKHLLKPVVDFDGEEPVEWPTWLQPKAETAGKRGWLPKLLSPNTDSGDEDPIEAPIEAEDLATEATSEGAVAVDEAAAAASDEATAAASTIPELAADPEGGASTEEGLNVRGGFWGRRTSAAKVPEPEPVEEELAPVDEETPRSAEDIAAAANEIAATAAEIAAAAAEAAAFAVAASEAASEKAAEEEAAAAKAAAEEEAAEAAAAEAAAAEAAEAEAAEAAAEAEAVEGVSPIDGAPEVEREPVAVEAPDLVELAEAADEDDALEEAVAIAEAEASQVTELVEEAPEPEREAMAVEASELVESAEAADEVAPVEGTAPVEETASIEETPADELPAAADDAVAPAVAEDQPAPEAESPAAALASMLLSSEEKEQFGKKLLLTPSTAGGTLLDGVTRRSLMEIAQEVLQVKVEARDVTLSEVLTAEEAFCSGTGAVLTPVGRLKHTKTDEDGEKVETTTDLSHCDATGPLTGKLREVLTGIQDGTLPDVFGWMVDAGPLAEASGLTFPAYFIRSTTSRRPRWAQVNKQWPAAILSKHT